MNLLIYDLGIALYKVLLSFASLFNSKANEFIKGRKESNQKIKDFNPLGKEVIWFHCASLGEFEQGRTLMEKFKTNSPSSLIVLSFFSPSGYLPKRNWNGADLIVYIPLDGKKESQKFIQLIKPSIVFFVKYEYWLHYFEILHKQGIPLFMLSSIYRKEQIFFKFYGGLHRRMLQFVTRFYVQDQLSKENLKKLNLLNSIVVGDTRVDRVYSLSKIPVSISSVENFLNGEKALIGGSSYYAEEKMMFQLIKDGVWNGKLIVVPHEVNESHINSIASIFKEGEIEVVRLSEFNDNLANARVLIIDRIGMLSRVYSYGHIAFIGGGFGKNIHNTLEPAAFGLPVIFGPRYKGFTEAVSLTKSGGMFCVSSYSDFKNTILFLKETMNYENASKICKNYILENSNATLKVWNDLILEGFVKPNTEA